MRHNLRPLKASTTSVLHQDNSKLLYIEGWMDCVELQNKWSVHICCAWGRYIKRCYLTYPCAPDMRFRGRSQMNRHRKSHQTRSNSYRSTLDHHVMPVNMMCCFPDEMIDN